MSHRIMTVDAECQCVAPNEQVEEAQRRMYLCRCAAVDSNQSDMQRGQSGWPLSLNRVVDQLLIMCITSSGRVEAVVFLTRHSVFTAHSTMLRPRVCCVHNIRSFPRYKSGTA